MYMHVHVEQTFLYRIHVHILKPELNEDPRKGNLERENNLGHVHIHIHTHCTYIICMFDSTNSFAISQNQALM